MKTPITSITLALTMLVFAACSKEAVPDVQGQSLQPPTSPTEVSKIYFTGNVVDLSLNAFSSSDPLTTYDLTVNRRLIQSFQLHQNDNLKWHLDQLATGTYRINIYIGYSNNQTPYFSKFQFTVSNGTSFQTVTSTQIDQRNYGFDLVIEK